MNLDFANMNMNRGSEGDIPVMLDSLYELFQERGDVITPTQLAERMEQKLHKHVQRQVASHLYILLGFDSRRVIGHSVSKTYIIPNHTLLAERRAQFCKVDISTSDKSKDPPIH